MRVQETMRMRAGNDVEGMVQQRYEHRRKQRMESEIWILERESTTKSKRNPSSVESSKEIAMSKAEE